MKIFATETESQPPKPKPIQKIFATETETESQPPKPKPIQKFFATETENRNRKSAETDSKYFCHRNRKLKPIDKNQLIILQHEKIFRNFGQQVLTKY